MIERGRAIALAATPGPWEIHPHSETTVVQTSSSGRRPVANCNTVESNWADSEEIANYNLANARFVAAFNPRAVLGLLDENAKLRAAGKRLFLCYEVCLCPSDNGELDCSGYKMLLWGNSE